ncbi:MAG: hypothetical protein OFPI_24160 [Osedax symbiont Rs2]|nr:MAG: hypothetical protein OFPI_24160 [Osedax symbiont Rs2]
MHNKILASGADIAFYAPLKSVDHPVPSGDRKIARLFVQALQHGGYKVQQVSRLRSFDKRGDPLWQQRIIAIATSEAARILRRWKKQQYRPSAWFSYHLYYKAPDLIGPLICRQLNIPYIVAEASWAAKRAAGRWSLFHQQVDIALKQACRVVCINPVDKIALDSYYLTLQRPKSQVRLLKAFIAPAEHNPNIEPVKQRLQLAAQFALNPGQPWLIVIAMMRSGDKYHSYQLLAKVTAQLQQRSQVLIVGSGENAAAVKSLFADQKHVFFAGAVDNSQIQILLPQFELLIWPAINEALGMVFLEAQQVGVAVVAGRQGGVDSLIEDGVTGRLVTATDSHAMAAAVDSLLADSALLTKMQRAAATHVLEHHSLAAAATQLQQIIKESLANPQPPEDDQ